MTRGILDRLYDVLLERKSGDPEKSYVAALYKKGVAKINEKIIEEARETVAEALAGDNEKLAAESADLLFHLMVLWAHMGVKPADVFAVLEKRFGTGGIEEKAARK